MLCNYSCLLVLFAVQFWSSSWSYIFWVTLSLSYVHWFTRLQTFAPLTLLGRLFVCGASIQPWAARRAAVEGRSLLHGARGSTVDAGSSHHLPHGGALSQKGRVRQAAAVVPQVARTRPREQRSFCFAHQRLSASSLRREVVKKRTTRCGAKARSWQKH